MVNSKTKARKIKKLNKQGGLLENSHEERIPTKTQENQGKEYSKRV